MQIPPKNLGACKDIANDGIKLVTFEVPKVLLADFDEAIKNDYGKNRSEALRDLMRQFIRKKNGAT